MNRLKNFKMFESYQVENGYLDVTGDNLTSLSELPEGIKILSCNFNKLSSLPNLPEGLIKLFCQNNSLTHLPELPKSLKSIGCSNNLLLTLPELPENFGSLECYNNRLTSLPKLPNTLKYLICHYNPLECLIPTKFIDQQVLIWKLQYYYPYIESYDGQKNILTREPWMLKQLMEQVKLKEEIKKEFAYLFTGNDLNLI